MSRASAMPVFGRLLILGLLLLAFGLRAYHLDYQSLWSDEGISLVRSSLPLGDMLAQMPTEHVPGYFVLLKGWMALTGELDYGLRYFSLLPSVWAVALIYRLASDLGSRDTGRGTSSHAVPRGYPIPLGTLAERPLWGNNVGLIVAALLATNGFQVWYAQEVRMYSWLLATGLLATLACWRLLTRSGGWGVWWLYIAATTATIYLHWFGFLVPLAHTVFALLWLLWRRDTCAFLRWVGAGLGVALLFAPWGWRALALLEFEGWRAPLDPRQVPWLLLQAYTSGETMPAPWREWLPWLYLALAALGIIAWTWHSRAAGLFLGTLLATALAVVWLLVVRQPDFHVRYPIFIAAPLLLLSAGGIAALDGRIWGASRQSAWLRLIVPTLATLLISANGLALTRLYYDSSLHKPNFRSAAMTINASVQPDDVVLVDGPNPALVFNHYYTGPAPVYDLRSLEGAEYAQVAATLAEATQGANQAWELLYFHTPGPVQFWLATHAWPAAPSDHNGIRILRYGLDSAPLVTQPLDVAFGDALTLTQAGVNASPVAAGDLVRVTTQWQVNAPAPDYKFSLRLQALAPTDAAGAAILADDYVPQNWFTPTSQWATGTTMTDQHALQLPTNLPGGRYLVTLRLYDPATGVAVEAVTNAGVTQDVRLGEVEVSE